MSHSRYTLRQTLIKILLVTSSSSEDKVLLSMREDWVGKYIVRRATAFFIWVAG